MSNELIVAVVPSEAFIALQPLTRNEASTGYVPIASLVSREDWRAIRNDRDAIRERFPDAIYLLPVPVDSVWEPPAEGVPNLAGLAGESRRRAHVDACRKSLHAFLNQKLARLDRMVRTGWWILARARVRVSVFDSVP